MKSEPVAVTTEEAVDGHCEKAMRIASVEQIELGKAENVEMGGSKVGKFGKIERQQNLKSVGMDGPKVGRFGKVGREQKCEEHRDGRSQKW